MELHSFMEVPGKISSIVFSRPRASTYGPFLLSAYSVIADQDLILLSLFLCLQLRTGPTQIIQDNFPSQGLYLTEIYKICFDM